MIVVETMTFKHPSTPDDDKKSVGVMCTSTDAASVSTLNYEDDEYAYMESATRSPSSLYATSPTIVDKDLSINDTDNDKITFDVPSPAQSVEDDMGGMFNEPYHSSSLCQWPFEGDTTLVGAGLERSLCDAIYGSFLSKMSDDSVVLPMMSTSSSYRGGSEDEVTHILEDRIPTMEVTLPSLDDAPYRFQPGEIDFIDEFLNFSE